MHLDGRLPWKARLHGIQGEIAEWVENWLHRKTQRVMVEGCFYWTGGMCLVVYRRDWCRVHCHLFSIINDLNENVQDMIKFADDTKMVRFQF